MMQMKVLVYQLLSTFALQPTSQLTGKVEFTKGIQFKVKDFDIRLVRRNAHA